MKTFDKALYKQEKQILSEMAYGFSANAQKISKVELVDKITKLTGKDIQCKFTSVVNATYKKNNPLGTIFKASQVSGLLNTNYAERKQEKITAAQPGDTYTPGGSYGTHTSPSIVEHTDKKTGKVKHYIQIIPESSASQRFIVKNNIGAFSEDTKDNVKPYLAPSQPQTNTSVAIRRYGIDSVVAIEIDGESFEITDVDTDRAAVLDIVNSGSTVLAAKYTKPANIKQTGTSTSSGVKPAESGIAPVRDEVAMKTSHNHTGGKPSDF